MKKGSAKGASYERLLCTSFSRWFSGGDSETLFWRTSGSGSRATTRRKKHKTLTKFQHGDMTYDDPEGRPLVEDICFEFKRYHQVAVFSVLYKMHPNKSLLSFWAQAHRDAAASRRHPILITRVDRGQSIMWIQSSLMFVAQRLFQPRQTLQFKVPCQLVVIKPEGKTKKRKGKRRKKIPAEVYELPTCEVTGFLLDGFFKHVDPREFIDAVSDRSLNRGS